MSKTLETKRRILQLLKKKHMTISELSEELGLSKATVSQHITELMNSGAIEKVNNEYFKKLKYYKTAETTNPLVEQYVKYIVGAVILIALVSGWYAYSLRGTVTPQPSITKIVNNSTNNNTNTTTALTVGGGGAFACPLSFYHINGSITNSSGVPVYYLNSSWGKVADYVLGEGASGSLQVSEFVNQVLPEPVNSTIMERQHFAILAQVGRPPLNRTSIGLNISLSQQNFTIASNETLNFNLTLTTSSSAKKITYWLWIDGPCGGGAPPVLVTVGNKPYNGTINDQGLFYP